MDEEEKYKEIKENMTILDLCRYQSLRIPSIALCILTFFFDLLYYSHSVVTDEIGLNPTLNLILMSNIEIIALMTLNLIVPCIRRKRTSIAMALIGLAMSLILMLLKIPSCAPDRAGDGSSVLYRLHVWAILCDTVRVLSCQC